MKSVAELADHTAGWSTPFFHGPITHTTTDKESHQMTDDIAKALQRIRTARYAEAERALKEHGIHERPDFPHGLRILVDDRFPQDLIGIFTAEGEQLLDLRKTRPTDDH